jgi:hypothetical protein
VKLLKQIPFEALFWFVGLLALALLETDVMQHLTLCPLKNVGFDFCPGCGLGRSISLFFHGEFSDSFHAHPMGTFTVFILSFRILNLTNQFIQNYGKSY